ncbi:hemolysin family protein [Paludibacterium purpuratum]|uniref:Polyamine export protein n=1 Tax=Paludibacterium purpuratum TaxID=1144873 RepID=A0A4R7B6Q8_9NEIS|nr:hemolysin family protein [Paludibacterium purpuratum]TDR80338.1 CBS domain containing-hemolysin-like protein [Paludibacterium purpuratum]
MSLSSHLLIIFLLMCTSAFFSVSEIALAASRKIKLRQILEEGDLRAEKVLALQEKPGKFFTVVQIGLNGVAILGGILGESALTPFFETWIGTVYRGDLLPTISFAMSFAVVTSLFIVFADLIPKRTAMIHPERIAVVIVGPLLLSLSLFSPLVWFFNGTANQLFKLFNMPSVRSDEITSDDIYAIMDAGAEAGVLQRQEHHLIENVFELESRTVPSSMSSRESIVYFSLADTEDEIREKIATQPHSKFLVCDETIDRVVGYVDSKDVLMRLLKGLPISLRKELPIRTVMVIPDSLTLSELLERFKASREDFAVVMNEYALVVGIITLNDVMSTVMGDLVSQTQEEQILRRDEHSWLIDGMTALQDVSRALGIDEFPDDANYETIGGFMMYMLRKIPKRTDVVEYGGYKFEVVDTENFKVDQLLVTQLDGPMPDEPNA